MSPSFNVLGAALVLAGACAPVGPGGGGGGPGDDPFDPGKADGFETPAADACPGGGPRLVGGRPAAWTVIHFAAGDNDLEEKILADIDEMELGHRGSDQVNVIVELDRRSQPGRTRYRIVRDSTRGEIRSEVLAQSSDEPDSADWRTLAEFGRWAVVCFPAEQYLFVLAGHGNGWSGLVTEVTEAPLADAARHARAAGHGEPVRMIAPDDSSGRSLYVADLVHALEVIGGLARQPGDPEWRNRLVAYGSDACLMGTMEVAYDLRNAVTYLVGSEETEPGSGWPYNTVIRELTERPFYYAERPHRLASMIVERYGASYSPTGGAGADDAITLAALDTGALIRARNRVDTIASLLLGLLDADPTLAPLLWEARHDAFNFGDAYTDLRRFLLGVRERMIAAGRMPERYARWTGDERARDLRDTIDDLTGALWPELVLASRSGDLFPGTGGISIFFPTDECGFALDLRRYAETPFAADTMWGTFVETMVRRHPQGAGVLAGRAQGTMSVSFDGLTWEGLPADCVLSGGVLEVYGYEGRCQNTDRGCRYAPQVSVELHAAGDELGARAGHVWAESPRLEAQLAEGDLAVETPAVVPGSSYEATVATEVTVDGARLPLRASFRCAGLQPLSCDERGPSVRR